MVAVELSSDDLGTSTSMFNFFVEAASDVSTFNPFEQDKCEGYKAPVAVRPKDFVYPTMSITKIDFTGSVTIKFSDPFVARQDLQILKESREINNNGDK